MRIYLFIEQLARGAAGLSSIVDKQFSYLIGESNCGKGKTTILLAVALGNYVKTFNADNLLLSSGNGEDNEKDNK